MKIPWLRAVHVSPVIREVHVNDAKCQFLPYGSFVNVGTSLFEL